MKHKYSQSYGIYKKWPKMGRWPKMGTPPSYPVPPSTKAAKIWVLWGFVRTFEPQ